MSARVIARTPTMLAAAVLSLTLTACGPSYTGETYSRGEMQRGGIVQSGRIISVEDVPISGTSSGLGTLGGGVAGGTIGASLAHGRTGSILAGVGGAIVGAIAGNAIERGITRGQGTRFIVQVDNGPVINVVQTNEAGLQTGDRVTIIEGGEKTRLAREGSPPPPAR
ncbi:MAG TPA: glycine zipper 2TM domain-containing protein [Vineibacter sp.]|nr:glycine zipper 2TM domain-containing protein [Vineibacter sp.]